MARIRCPTCRAEQETRSESPDESCVICGAPLQGGGTSRPHEGVAARPMAAPIHLPEQAPPGQFPEIDEILGTYRRVTSLLALIPFWGLWRLWRSDAHSRSLKIVLSLLSIGLTAALGLAVWATVPDAEERAAATARNVSDRIDELAQLAQQFREEYGAYPDAEEWARSSGSGDPRFSDPWGRPYVYEPTARGFTIGTYGRDGVPGGGREDRDIFVSIPPDSR